MPFFEFCADPPLKRLPNCGIIFKYILMCNRMFLSKLQNRAIDFRRKRENESNGNFYPGGGVCYAPSVKKAV